MKIWLVWIVVPSFGGVSEEVFKTCHALKNRFVVLMNRKSGCMRDSHAIIQHFFIQRCFFLCRHFAKTKCDNWDA